MIYAWIENGTVRDLHPNPSAAFHPTVAKKYTTTVPTTTKVGATLVDGEWVNPQPPTPEAAPEPDPVPAPLTYPRFVALVREAGGLTADVALSIVDGTHTSPEVRFLRALLLEATGPLERDDPLIQSGLDTLVQETVLTQEGRDAIIAAWPVQ